MSVNFLPSLGCFRNILTSNNIVVIKMVKFQKTSSKQKKTLLCGLNRYSILKLKPYNHITRYKISSPHLID